MAVGMNRNVLQEFKRLLPEMVHFQMSLGMHEYER
jgi:hypothetical protein